MQISWPVSRSLSSTRRPTKWMSGPVSAVLGPLLLKTSLFSLSLSHSLSFSLFSNFFLENERTNERTNALSCGAGPGLQPTTTKVELLRISNYTTLHYTVTHFPIWAKPSRAEPSQAKRLFVRSFTRPFVRPSDRHYQGRSWWWVSFSLSLLPSSSSSSSLSTLEHIKIQNRQPNKHTRDFTLFFTCGHTAQKERKRDIYRWSSSSTCAAKAKLFSRLFLKCLKIARFLFKNKKMRIGNVVRVREGGKGGAAAAAAEWWSGSVRNVLGNRALRVKKEEDCEAVCLRWVFRGQLSKRLPSDLEDDEKENFAFLRWRQHKNRK